MYAVTGITGQVGGIVARALLDSDEAVRAVVRDPVKGAAWAANGGEFVVAEMTDAVALTDAFSGMEGVFLLVPPMFDPAPGFPEVRAVIDALTLALRKSRPPKIVLLSTVGAQAAHSSLLSQLGLVERALQSLDLPVTFLRAAWFIENAAADVASARETGVITSFLKPDRRIPMVATKDIGRVAAGLLREIWTSRRVVNLEGPRRVAPLDVAHAFSEALGRPVRVEAAPRDTWEATFAAQGAKYPGPRAQMLDGFNQGWLAFDEDGGKPVRGVVTIDDVVAGLVGASGEGGAGSSR